MLLFPPKHLASKELKQLPNVLISGACYKREYGAAYTFFYRSIHRHGNALWNSPHFMSSDISTANRVDLLLSCYGCKELWFSLVEFSISLSDLCQCSKLGQKSCQSCCLESQIINIKLKKSFKKSQVLLQICLLRADGLAVIWNTVYALIINGHTCMEKSIIVRRAGLLWSQQDFEWRWSVPLFKCLTVLEFSFILFDLCLLITFFNFIMNYVPIVTFWIFTYHEIWILSIMFCFIWSYWIIYFLACLEVSWRVVS